MIFWEYLNELNTVSVVLRLLLAVLCGGIIGIDRGIRRQAAGFRTHILVCMASALVMITNIYIIIEYAPGSDPTRIAAQVVSGIGFLGVGTIIVTGNKQIRGLTTAAGLWASACMGLAIGAGHFVHAIFSCVIIYFVMAALNGVEHWFYQHAKIVELYMEFEDIKYVSEFLVYIRENDMKASNLELTRSKLIGETTISALLTLRIPQRKEHSEILGELGHINGINFIDEM